MLPLAIAVIAVLVRLLIWRSTHSTAEDFYITLRYAENLAHGCGFVYNVGERVLGATTPLYTLLLAGAAALRLDPVAAGKLLNILADGGTCFLLARLLSALKRPTAGAAASLLFAATSTPINFGTDGMETGLVTLTGLCAIYAAVRGRSLLLWLSLAVLFLLRVDGIALAVFLIGGWMWERRRIDLRHAVLALSIVAPWLLFAALYFGSPIPESVTAKLVVYSHSRTTADNLPYFHRQFTEGAPQLLLTLACLVGMAVAWRRYPGMRAPILWMLVYYSIMLASHVPPFGWYFVPPLPVYYACACIGFAAGADLLLRRLPPGRVPAWTGPALVLLLALPLFYHVRSIRNDIAAAQRLEDTVRKPLGLWIADYTPPTDHLMLEPIGYIGYFSHRYVLDVVGLVSPQVLPYYRQSGDPLLRLVDAFRPELLVLRVGEAQRLGLTPGARRAVQEPYTLVKAFPEPGPPVLLLYRVRR